MTLAQSVTDLVTSTDQLAETVATKFFDAGSLPITPSLITDGARFTGLCGGSLGVTKAWDNGAYGGAWSGQLVAGAVTSGTVTVLDLAVQSPFSELAKLLDETEVANWNLRSVKLAVTLTAGTGITPDFLALKQTVPYQGKTPIQTSLFARVESQSGNIRLSAFGVELDSALAGAGWKHHAVKGLLGTRGSVRFVGTGSMVVQLALPYMGTGWHSGAPVFQF